MRAAITATAFLLLASSGQTATLVVPDSYPDIQSAVNAAVHGDTVLVRSGVYTGTGNVDVDFGGTNLILLGEGGAGATVVDCAGLARALHLHSGENETSVIEGFTFKNGAAVRGGAVLCASAWPSFRFCVFTHNQADEAGGAVALEAAGAEFQSCAFLENAVLTNGYGQGGAGIHCTASSPSILSCTFSGGSSSSGGGVYCINGSSPEITDCAFDGNEGWYNGGGGIFCWTGCNPTVTDCSFTGNTAQENGGGIFCNASSPLIQGCNFDGNEAYALSVPQGGGGVCIDGGSPQLFECKFTANTSPRGGGVCCRGGSSPTLTDCLFQNCTAAAGAGVYCRESSSPHVADSEFTGGTATSGGGVYSDNSTPFIEDCILYSNEATGSEASHGGGAVHVHTGGATIAGCTIVRNIGIRGGGVHVRTDAFVQVLSSTLADCTGTMGGALYLNDATVTLSNSIISGCEGVSAVGDGGAVAAASCTDIWGNSGGDWTGPLVGQQAIPGNICEDPVFCGGTDVHEAYQLQEDSPCTAGNSVCGLIGAWSEGCAASAVDNVGSWGGIKALFR